MSSKKSEPFELKITSFSKHFPVSKWGWFFVKSILGINKRLTTHTARKTVASTVLLLLLLYNDVPMEIVSQLLGHSSISITEDSYGKVVPKKVSEEVKKLNRKLN